MTHRILLSTLVIDAPVEVRDRTVEFWATALGAEATATPMPQYHILHGAAAPNRMVVQGVDTGTPAVHIDIHTDDLDAEVQRLTDGGADARRVMGRPPRQLGRDARPERHGVLRRLGAQPAPAPEGSRRLRSSSEGGRMTTTTGSVYYDPYNPEINADPQPTFRRLRAEAPLYYNEPHDFYA